MHTKSLKPNPLSIRSLLLTALALLGTTWLSQGQLVIEVGPHDLLPNLADQTIDLFVENIGSTGVPVGGISLNVQVADSGPASKDGFGSIDGPNITGVELLAGTIFESNNNGEIDAGSIPQFANFTTTTSSESVTLEANTTTKLATITISTEGFTTPETWDFKLFDTINGSTKYFDPVGGDIFPNITDGTISVVPEPMSAAMVACLLVGLAVLHRRKIGVNPSLGSRATDSRFSHRSQGV
jgi:hypothetical protein